MGMSREEFERVKARAAGDKGKKAKRPPRVRGVAAKEDRTADGIVFASRREMRRYRELRNLRKQGIVLFFLRQTPFHLPGGIRYLADFLVVWRYGPITVEDVKGLRTDTYKLKKKQVEEIYGIRITEI